jgi:hypothetical protein
MLIAVMTLLVLFAGLTIPAQASIRYTPVNTAIPNDQAYGVDFNHDGNKDFWIGSFFGPFVCGAVGGGAKGLVYVSPVQSTSGVILNSGFAAALPAGISVGPGKSFATGQTQLTSYTACNPDAIFHFGNWFDVNNHYLGMEFHVSGQTYYGWVELSVLCQSFRLITTVIGFAYESTPGKAIITGQTGGAGSTSITLKVTSPINNSTVTNPVHIAATASGPNPISQIQVWVNFKEVFHVSGGSLNTNVTLPVGSNERFVVQAVDSKGNIAKVVYSITVKTASSADTLTGFCWGLVEGGAPLQCGLVQDLAQCPVGRVAAKPTTVVGCRPPQSQFVDLSTSCQGTTLTGQTVKGNCVVK